MSASNFQKCWTHNSRRLTQTSRHAAVTAGSQRRCARPLSPLLQTRQRPTSSASLAGTQLAISSIRCVLARLSCEGSRRLGSPHPGRSECDCNLFVLGTCFLARSPQCSSMSTRPLASKIVPRLSHTYAVCILLSGQLQARARAALLGEAVCERSRRGACNGRVFGYSKGHVRLSVALKLDEDPSHDSTAQRSVAGVMLVQQAIHIPPAYLRTGSTDDALPIRQGHIFPAATTAKHSLVA